jgi:3-methylcrotonyl-CoA carboxylase alpha subunit
VKTSWRDGDRVRTVELSPLGGGRFRAEIDGTPFELQAEALEDGRMRLRTEAGDTMAEVTVAGPRRFVRLGTLDFVLDREATARSRAAGPQAGALTAPMNGVVTRVLVEPDDEVTRGQPLVAVEAMKMEHLVRAPRDGRVRAVHASPGAMVQGGTTLVELHPETPA